MSAYLPIHDQIQPIFDTPLPASKDRIDKEGETDPETESDSEPEPLRTGHEQIASVLEANEAISLAYKRDVSLNDKLLISAQKIIIGYIGKHNEYSLTAEDFLIEAIKRILDGKRKWDKVKVPKIENLIIMTMVSLIRIEFQRFSRPVDQLYKEYEVDPDYDWTDKNRSKPYLIKMYGRDKHGKKIENTIADNEKFKLTGREEIENAFDFEQPDENEFFNKIESMFEDDEVAYFVLQEILDGEKSNINMAAKYGISVSEVENAKKRIKRKLIKEKE